MGDTWDALSCPLASWELWGKCPCDGNGFLLPSPKEIVSVPKF